MTQRPASELNWGGTAIEPSGGQKTQGFAPGDRPPAQWKNWELQTVDLWLKFLNATFGDLVTSFGLTFSGDSTQIARAQALRTEVAAMLSPRYDTATGVAESFMNFAASEQRIIAGGQSGKLFSSDDFGKTWTSRTLAGGTGADVSIAFFYNGNLFVVAGTSGMLQTSGDGASWTARTSGFGSDTIFGVASRSTALAIVGANGANSYSTNGTTYTANTDLVGAGYDITDIAVAKTGPSVFVCCGHNGGATRANYIHRSTNGGQTWAPVSLTSVLAATEFIDQIEWHTALGFVGLVKDSGSGEYTSVITSADGLTWVKKGATDLGVLGIAGGCRLSATVGGLLLVSETQSQQSAYSLDGEQWLTAPVARGGFPDSCRLVKFSQSETYIMLQGSIAGDIIYASAPWV